MPDEPGEPVASAEENTPLSREPFENLGELPRGYGVDTIFLIAQEPHWLFTYWDIDIHRHPGGAAFLRYHHGDGTLEGEIEVPFETRNWYVPVESASKDYFVEIGFYRGEKWNLIARSVVVTTPPENMAHSEAFDYATVPFHLSFQRMLDELENARRSGEDLLSAMARLQQKGDFSAFGAAGVPDLLSDDQRALLRALLGPGMLSKLTSGGQAVGEIETALRTYLEEQLSSGGGEFLTSFRNAVGVFSGQSLSSDTVGTSWEVAALSSWAVGAVTSWAGLQGGLTSFPSASGEASRWNGAAASWTTAQTAGIRGETSWAEAPGGSWAGVLLASWAGAGATSWNEAAGSSLLSAGGSSETFAGLSSWLQGVQSSFLPAGESSGASAGLSSWLQGVQSSWAQAALSSWNSAEVTSWFSAEAAAASWGGSSETLSSSGG